MGRGDLSAGRPRRAIPVTVVDGGLSTALDQLGVPVSGRLWTARAVLDRPDAVVAAHLGFLRAGARVLITASYQAWVDGFLAAGLDAPEARAALRRTTTLARDAVARFAAEDPTGAAVVRVGASVGPFGATRGGGAEYGPPPADHQTLVGFHRRRLGDLVATAPDLVVCETISSTAETRAVIEALAAHPPLPTWVTVTCRAEGETWAGDPVEDVVAVACSLAQVEAVGVNCTDPRLVTGTLRRMAAVTDLPLVAEPNRGQRWDGGAGRWSGRPVPLAAALVHDWVAAGARFIGGCCGIGPDDLARLAAIVATIPPPPSLRPGPPSANWRG